MSTLDLPSLRVDASLDEMTDRAAEAFAPALATMPRGGDVAGVRRFENDAAGTQIRLYHESLGNEAPPERKYAFACECGAPGCRDTIALTVSEYEALSAAGDRSPLRRPTP